MNLELLGAIHSLERAEALERHFRRSGDELEELGTFSLVEASQCTPEPLNLESNSRIKHLFWYEIRCSYLDRRCLIFMVLCICTQVLDVDIGQSGDKQFKLLLVENRDESFRDDVIESFQKCVESEILQLITGTRLKLFLNSLLLD